VLATAAFMRNERDNIVKEIYTSEISYLSSLHHLVLQVMERCAERFKDAEMQVLFSNVPSIRLIHTMLANRLHERLSDW
jgi:RhoGEF domain